MKMQAPVTVDIRIGITNGQKVGEAVISMPVGMIPTAEAIDQAGRDFELNDLPDGFRLMNKAEFIEYQCAKYAGGPMPTDIGHPDFES